MRIGNPKPQL